MELIIVESPTKAKTIGKFLGKKYKVESSYGHVRDLPRSKLGVDVLNNFNPSYVVPLKSRKNVTLLKNAAKQSDKIILATDEDREGEAIAWHIAQILNLGEIKNKKSPPKADPPLAEKIPTSAKATADKKNSKMPTIERIVFHEITEKAINEALQHPRSIDLHLVDAQQARRVLDRLVGYLLSPFLWKKIFRGLSAGRVQSVALRLIVDREKEIKAFKSDEYWSIEAILSKDKKTDKTFSALLYAKNGENINKLDIKTKDEAEKIVSDLRDASYSVEKIEKKSVKRNPLPPFTTSTLQQEANKRLRFSAKQTMMAAQGLYENGLITYMRTDSVNLSEESLKSGREWILKNFGDKYLTEKAQVFKNKSRLAQEAHEAIRPTNPFTTHEEINAKSAQEKKLYELIWRRFIASQMPSAIFDATTVDIFAENSNKYKLRANGNILNFDGFLKVWQTKFSEKDLPDLEEKNTLILNEIKNEQHFTEPPPRYNEASLIKTLEELGIGRPSTYAPIISLIQGRNYAEKDETRRFKPTEIGTLINNLLCEHFPEIVDIGFTVQMEESLDEIAEGGREWHSVIESFYKPFAEQLEIKYKEVEKITPDTSLEVTSEVCDKCGKQMVVKMSRFGKFLACSGFPECRNIKKIINANNPNEAFGNCSKCGTGIVIKRRTKKGRWFFGCSRYPDCDFASWKNPKDDETKETQSETNTP